MFHFAGLVVFSFFSFMSIVVFFFFFFFQAEDGIRDPLVTGVQTCALPISSAAPGCCVVTCRVSKTGTPSRLSKRSPRSQKPWTSRWRTFSRAQKRPATEIGRASCRERV